MKRDILNLSFLIPNLLLWLKISIFRCLLYSFKAGYKNTKQTKAKILNGNLRFFPQLFSLSQLMAKYIFGLWLFLLNISKIGSLFQIQPLLGKKKPKQQQQKKTQVFFTSYFCLWSYLPQIHLSFYYQSDPKKILIQCVTSQPRILLCFFIFYI